MSRDEENRPMRVKQSIDDRLPGGLKIGAFALYVHTRRGLPVVDRVAEWDGWDRYHDAGVVTLVGLQAVVVGLIGVTAWVALTGSMEPTAANDPKNAVAIPGLNDFMPLSAAVFVVAGLVLATGLHELGHAIACRSEGVAIEEWGVALLLGVIPVAGYVLPDEDDVESASDRSRMRVFSVGVFNNLLLAVVAFGVLLLPFTASPTEIYLEYFGWALSGGTPPSAASIGALGVGSNLLFWTGFLSANVALINALPIGILDGGRVLRLLVDRASERVSASPRTVSVAMRAVGVCTAALVVLAIFGPYLR
jgi:membrane-associated protease RseP (regulator of RpoE activity)